MYSLTLQRRMSKRTGDEKIKAQADYILERGFGGARGKTWKTSINHMNPVQQNGMWVFTFMVDCEKISGQRNGEAEYKQWEEIKAMIQQTGAAQKFQPHPWTIIENGTQVVIPAVHQNLPVAENLHAEGFNNVVKEINQAVIGNIKEIQKIEVVKQWNELIVPDELLGAESDKHLAEHPAWKDLYGVNPQIRIILSNIRRAQETNGESRNHAVMFGHAGCGKTTTMFALEKMFGTGSVLKLDATSTTKAGLEKMFFNDLKDIPPLVFMEEAEKADPEALKIWLGALDDRGEIRKINFRVNQLREVKVLFICSVNNKSVFDRMMGSDGTEAGALSSRCVTQVYYPRPSEGVLLQILNKEIREHGGKQEWIQPAIEMASALDIHDPRIVRSYLAGGDRLLDKTYQRDWLAVYEAQKIFNKAKQ